MRLRPRSERRPPEGEILASVDSPPMERLIELTNKPSDNFFAEMLLKDLALQANGRGTTRGGARLAAGYARGAWARACGWSTARDSRAATGPRRARWSTCWPRWSEHDTEEYGGEYRDSLSIAGRDGTLATRMRRGPARSHCVGKTGTLSNVSALSGYCELRSGEQVAFSILMNNVYPGGARSIQDAMVQAIAAT